VDTLFGEVRLWRDYYVAGDGSSRVPLDESLGLLEGYSPGLAKMMARIAAQDSFEEGSKDLLAYAGVKVGPKGAQNVLDLRTFLLSNRFDDLWLARDQKAA